MPGLDGEKGDRGFPGLIGIKGEPGDVSEKGQKGEVSSDMSKNENNSKKFINFFNLNLLLKRSGHLVWEELMVDLDLMALLDPREMLVYLGMFKKFIYYS